MNEFVVFEELSHPVLLNVHPRRCPILKQWVWRWSDLLLEPKITFIRITDGQMCYIIDCRHWMEFLGLRDATFICAHVRPLSDQVRREMDLFVAVVNSYWFSLSVSGGSGFFFFFSVINQRQRSRTHVALMLVSQGCSLCLWATLPGRNAWIAIARSPTEAFSYVVVVSLLNYTFLSCQ